MYTPCVCLLSCFSRVQLFVTPWTVTCQAPLSMRSSSQENWSGLPCSPPGHLPHPGMESTSLPSPALAGRFFTAGATWEAQLPWYPYQKPTDHKCKNSFLNSQFYHINLYAYFTTGQQDLIVGAHCCFNFHFYHEAR